MSLGTLASIRQNRHEQSPLREVYDELVARLRRLEIGVNAPQVGQRFPDLTLPDARGRHRSLRAMLDEGPLVLSFQRGGWCPFCVGELGSWREMWPSLKKLGAGLAIVTAEVGGRSRALADMVGSEPVALCDVDHGAALQLGLTFYLGPKVLEEYRAYGIDMAALYGSDSGILPIPATFVVRQDGIIVFAFIDVDFRNRAEPADIVRLIARLQDGSQSDRMPTRPSA